MKTGHLENNRRTQWTLQAVFFLSNTLVFVFFVYIRVWPQWNPNGLEYLSRNREVSMDKLTQRKCVKIQMSTSDY